MDELKLITSKLEKAHKFFQEWFRGEKDKSDFKEFDDIISLDYKQITPDGRFLDFQEVRDIIEKSYNIGPWNLEISDITIQPYSESILATYTLTQSLGDQSQNILNSSLFVKDGDNLAYVFLQQTMKA